VNGRCGTALRVVDQDRQAISRLHTQKNTGSLTDHRIARRGLVEGRRAILNQLTFCRVYLPHGEQMIIRPSDGQKESPPVFADICGSISGKTPKIESLLRQRADAADPCAESVDHTQRFQRSADHEFDPPALS
jgi:hypothetical protein